MEIYAGRSFSIFKTLSKVLCLFSFSLVEVSLVLVKVDGAININ